MKNSEAELIQAYESLTDAQLVEALLQERVCHCICPQEQRLRYAAAQRILGKRIAQLAHAECGALLQQRNGALICPKCLVEITDDAQIEKIMV